jgi:Sec7-like guanine-nucleotide exchange factor
VLGSSPADIASFLRVTAGLSRRGIGLFLGHEAHVAHLRAYAETFNFRGLSIPDAMRLFLCTFRMPGEAQVVDRIMEAFAIYMHAQVPSPVADAEAAYMLCFSLMMLQTDLHSTSVRVRAASL